MPTLIIVISLAVIMLIGLVVLIYMILCKPEKEESDDAETGFSALARNPEFANALQKSFANQARMVAGPASVVEPEKYIFECLTCHLIQMGDNMAYSDNTCPHCGTTMDRD